MSLYGDYLKERMGKDCIETDRGFVTFIIREDKCYLEDMYVLPDFRNVKHDDRIEAVFLTDEVFRVAKERGCNVVFSSVVPSLPQATETTLSLIRYGFKVISSTENFILFEKGVE